MNIHGKVVTLRAVEPEDMELLRKMLNDPEIENKVVGWSFPVSSYGQRKWYDSTVGDQRNLRFIIETKDENSVGLITLHGIDWKNRVAGNGIKLANTDIRGKGIGTDALMSIMRYAFDELGLHRLETTCFEDNIPSQKLYEKCGWKIEGLKRECAFKNGSFRNLYVEGILSSDYKDLIAKNHYWDAD